MPRRQGRRHQRPSERPEADGEDEFPRLRSGCQADLVKGNVHRHRLRLQDILWRGQRGARRPRLRRRRRRSRSPLGCHRGGREERHGEGEQREGHQEGACGRLAAQAGLREVWDPLG